MRLVSSTLEVRNEQEMKFYSHIQRVTHPIANIKRMKNFHRNKNKMLISGSSTMQFYRYEKPKESGESRVRIISH